MARQLHWIGVLLLGASFLGYGSNALAQESGDATAEESSNNETANTDDSANESTEETDAQEDATADAEAATDTETNNDDSADSDESATEASESQDTSDANQGSTAEADQAEQADNSDQTSQDQSGAIPKRDDSANSNKQADGPDKNRAKQDSQSGRRQSDADERGNAKTDAQRDKNRQQELRRGIRLGEANDRGLTINTVERNSWYYTSGFRQGDVIVSVQGRPVRRDADFWRFVILEPGRRVPVVVLRGGQRETIYIVYQDDVVQARPDGSRSKAAYLGVMFRPEVRDAAVVRSVNPGSPAQKCGVQAGDMIVALNDQEIRTYADAISMIRAMRPGDELEIVVGREHNEEQLVATLGSQPDLQTTTRRTDVNVGRTNEDNFEVQVDADSDGDSRARVRDQNNDGNRDRALLPGRRN